MINNPGLIKTFLATAAIAPHRIVKFGADDDHVTLASAATDALFGVTELGADAAEDKVDVVLTGACHVEYGGAVTRGDPLTADADGKAIVAAPAAGSNVRIVGHAAESGVAGDVGSLTLDRGTLQG